VTVTTDKSSYKYRERINVEGNLTLGDTSSDAFVGIEVSFMDGSFSNYTHFLTRTATIGNPNTGTANMTIESLTTTDLSSPPQPKTTFNKGEKLGVNVTVKNNYFNDRTVVITVIACDNDSTPLTSEVAYVQTTILGDGGIVKFYPQFTIDTWVSTGNAKVYANVYSDWPSLGGHPWCGEKNTIFTIAQATLSSSECLQPSSSSSSPKAESENTYTLSFRLPPYAPEGNYSVDAGAFAQGWIAYNTTTFSKFYQVVGDVDFDHKITILDLVLVASTYGSKSGDSRWNPEGDLVPDGKIDIADIVMVASKYGMQY
jgi:hypothetical protein